MKKQDILPVWDRYKNREVPDIEVPPELPEPDVPSIQETELGRKAKHLCDAAIASAHNLRDEELQRVAVEVMQSCQDRGITIPN
jgi:hypothetical protein